MHLHQYLAFFSAIQNPCPWESPPLNFVAPRGKPRSLCSEVLLSDFGRKVFEQTWRMVWKQNTCGRHSMLNQHWFKIKWAIYRRGCLKTREMEIKATVRYYSTPIRLTKIKCEKLEFSQTTCRTTNLCSYSENSLALFIKVKDTRTLWRNSYTCTRMFTVVLFTIAITINS